MTNYDFGRSLGRTIPRMQRSIITGDRGTSETMGLQNLLSGGKRRWW